jgi:hypothetical protein
LSFSRAFQAAHPIHDKSFDLLENHGVFSLFIAAGLASLEPDGFDLTMPILLWPVSLVSQGDDFVIELIGPAVANPYLIRHFEIAYGAVLDPLELSRRAESASELLPIAVFDYLKSSHSAKAASPS